MLALWISVTGLRGLQDGVAQPSFAHRALSGRGDGGGGILRDIFTMGARPIALLDALRFGGLDNAKNRHLVKGVVAGIAGYGNCMGVPTVGGEIVLTIRIRRIRS